MNTEFDQKIEPYESMNEEMRPPCHEELMAPLFNIVKDGKELDDGEFKMPIDLIREKYPESGERDLERIMEYLEEAEQIQELLNTVCWLSNR